MERFILKVSGEKRFLGDNNIIVDKAKDAIECLFTNKTTSGHMTKLLTKNGYLNTNETGICWDSEGQDIIIISVSGEGKRVGFNEPFVMCLGSTACIQSHRNYLTVGNFEMIKPTAFEMVDPVDYDVLDVNHNMIIERKIEETNRKHIIMKISIILLIILLLNKLR